MALAIGIVGLPNVGKSTLFNALSNAGAQAANYPFCTIEPNVGVVPVPDPRLAVLSDLLKSKKIIPTSLEFVDIAGLVKGASKGEGLGNQFLGTIRQVDAIAHVLRCFADPDVVHVEGALDPARDHDVIDTELCLKDLESVEKRRDRAGKDAKGLGKAAEEAKVLSALLDRVRAGLDQSIPVRAQSLTADEHQLLRELFLLTDKPVLYVANIGEDQIGKEATDPQVAKVKAIAEKEGARWVSICSKVEAEIQELPEADRADYLLTTGLTEPGLNRLVRAGYDLLGLITYITTGPEETRAWTIKKGTKAPGAAGVIHTDFERGFIKAEVMAYEELATYKTEAIMREKGLLRVEGKEYVVNDGDVMHFRFNV
jgi:GTP-binding protein YchF